MAEKKNIYYIIAAIVIVVIIVVLMRRPAEEAAPVVTEPESTVIEPTAPTPTEEPEVIRSETGEVEEIKYASRGILSDVKCENGKMSAIITNVQDITANIEPNTYETDVRIIVDGIVSKWFVCDKTELAPGEYTYCEDLLGPMSDRLTNDPQNEVAVWFLSDPKNRGSVTDIACTGSAEIDQIDSPYNP